MNTKIYPMGYGVRSRNKNILSTSSSGGIFSEISNHMIKEGYIVYGCILNENLDAIYLRGTTEKDIEKMRTSKYVQSNIVGVADNIKQDIKQGEKVLFISTPCYIDIIKSKLTEDELKKIILIDFICHGTPNKKFFKDHLESIEKKYSSKVKKYSFRDKRYGWGHDEFAILENNKKVDSIKYVHQYKRLFYKNYILAKGCFSCKYTSIKRNSDFTIGDFWGVEELLGVVDNKGMSALLINTKKGEEIFKNLKENVEYYQVGIDDFQHGPLKKPTKMPKDYEQFIEDYKKYGYEYVSKKYASPNFKIYFSTLRRRSVHLLKADYPLFWLKYKIKRALKNGK